MFFKKSKWNFVLDGYLSEGVFCPGDFGMGVFVRVYVRGGLCPDTLAFSYYLSHGWGSRKISYVR